MLLAAFSFAMAANAQTNVKEKAKKKGDEDNHIFWRQIAEKVRREFPATS